MTVTRHFTSYTHARRDLRSVLDAADLGVVTTVERDAETYVVVVAKDQRANLAALRPANAQVVAEGGGWALVLPGLPLHGDGRTFDDAVDDAVDALREYADDWNERLRTAPNHRQHRVVVELVELSTDDELRRWLLGLDDGSGLGVAVPAGAA